MSVVYRLLMVLFTSAVLSRADTVINVYASDSDHTTDKHKVESTDVVAFSVGRKTRFEPSSTSRVPMDHVFYNKGGYFNMKTSIFTAPVSGVYAFYFGGSGKPGKSIHLNIYAGNPEKDVASTYNANRGSHGQASGFVIIEMKKRDQASVWLRGGQAIYEQPAPSMHFNGFLIAKTHGE